MDKKVSAALEKALQDKSKGNYQKALKRLDDTIGKFPGDIELYLEAADVCLEGGETLQATQYIKRAQAKFRSEQGRVDSFAREKLISLKDPVLAKFLLENSIKKRDLDEAMELLEDLQDRTVRDLLQRTRTKKQSLTSASHGGYALKTETLMNAMSEALLCLRLGRVKEAVRAFLKILEEKPVENEILEPFFAGLEKKYPKAGRIRYAYACSLLIAQQYDKAVSRLVDAVKMEPRVGDNCLARLRELTVNFDTPPESVKQALIEMLMITGDVPRAAELLREALSESPENARGVLEIIRPHLESAENGLVLHYLYMEAALLAEQTVRVIEVLKPIMADGDRRPDLFEWLEKTSRDRFLPAEVMVLHGELAIELDKRDRALEIFEAVANNSHADIPSIVNILVKNQARDPRFAEFAEKHDKTQTAETGYESGGMEFEHFENNEFKFSNDASGKSSEKDEPPAETTGLSGQEAGEPAGVRQRGHIREAGKAASAGEDVDIVWDEEDSSGTTYNRAGEEPVYDDGEDDSWLETSSDAVIPGAENRGRTALPDETVFTGTEAGPEPEPVSDESEPEEKPGYVINEEHVRNLSWALRDAGAALFFHVATDQEGETGSDEEPDYATEPAPEDTPDEGHAPDGNLVGELEQEPTTGQAEDEKPEQADEPERRPEAERSDDEQPEQVLEPEQADDDESVQVLEAREADDDEEPDQVLEAREADDDEEPDQVLEARHADDDEPEGEDFDSKFGMFLDGRLDNDAVTELLQDALDQGKIDELRELLHFEPADPEEEFVRKRFQVEYYVFKDLPARALELIDTIEVDDLPRDQKYEILAKKAACLQKISDFDSAHSIYTQLLDESPCPEIEKTARRNYERYLEDQCDRKPVLEKTTSLLGD